MPPSVARGAPWVGESGEAAQDAGTGPSSLGGVPSAALGSACTARTSILRNARGSEAATRIRRASSADAHMQKGAGQRAALETPDALAPSTSMCQDMRSEHARLLRRLIPLKLRSYRTEDPAHSLSLHGDSKPRHDEPMDFEELAALNSIINTRRSRDVAEALARCKIGEHSAQCASAPHADARSSNAPRDAQWDAQHIRFAPLPTVQYPWELEDDSESDADASSEDLHALHEQRLADDTDRDALDGATHRGRRSSAPDAMPKNRLVRSLSGNALRLQGDQIDGIWSMRRWSWSRLLASNADENALEGGAEYALTPEDRLRRRRSIREQRPGGTGMVTLVDGERVVARQVGNPLHERTVEELTQSRLWGYAALARQRDLDAKVQKQHADAGHATAGDTSTHRAGHPIALSADKAAEIRRRYEDEVVALGSEILAKVRRRNASSQPHSMQRHFAKGPDPSVSMPSPSPLLPRRPDARGFSVVPLPDLGVRPRMPVEGRSYLSLIDDDAVDPTGGVGATSRPHHPAPEIELEKNAGLSREELDEEERLTSLRWAHATTRAAGQERLSSRSVSHTHQAARPSSASHAPSGFLSDYQDEFWPSPSATRKFLNHYKSGRVDYSRLPNAAMSPRR